MAFSTHDHVPDSPTNVFATWNSLARMSNSNGTFSDGNLTYTSSTSTSGDNKTWAYANIKIPSSGFYYIEFIQTAGGVHSSNYPIGLSKVDPASRITSTLGSLAGDYAVRADNGDKYNNGNVSQYANVNLSGLVRIAINMDTGKVWWGKDSNWFASGDPSNDTNEAFSGLEGEYYLTNQSWANGSTTYSGTFRFNFGQDPTFGGATGLPTAPSGSPFTDAKGYGSFYYDPPTGALALCTANLPDPDIDPNADDLPEDYFKAKIYSGTGTPNTSNLNGLPFKPDLVWIKSRTTTNGNNLFDSVRGAGWVLSSNSTGGEGDNTAYMTGFTNDGVSFGSVGGDTNASGTNYVAWCFRAGGNDSTYNWGDGTGSSTYSGIQSALSLPASSTSGMITPSGMSVNQKAGFSIIKYTGTGSAATVPHGLSSAPEMVICKTLDTVSATNWVVYFKGATTNSQYLMLNSTGSVGTYTNYWGTAEPTNNVFSVAAAEVDNNHSNANIIAYCWHSVAGYSAFGSYEGNGSTDGPFIYTGFKPAWVMIKNIDTTSSTLTSWGIYDNARNPYNVLPASNLLWANKSASEGKRGDGSSTNALVGPLDFLSNGFKVRSTACDEFNTTVTYIYAAFAQTPFKYSATNAR